ncbi:uracil-DNA glycosylase, mitochondrial-like isoform X1 [Nymphaea colorata]|nr:uracil-DNA glycosylase, mitochondrial-like isoform X1 [Nymphaea colorata]
MASSFLRPSVATNPLLSGRSSRAIAMASQRTVFDLLSPRKKPKTSPSPLAATDGASLPSHPLPTNNRTASPNLPTLPIGPSSLRGSVVSGDSSPCSAGDRTTSLNPSSGCFSVVDEIREKGSDGNVIPSSSVASDSGSFSSDDKVRDLNPSCVTVADVGGLISRDSNVAVPSSMAVDHTRDPSFIEALVQNRSADSLVDSADDDGCLSVAQGSASVCENQKGDLPLDGKTIENPSCDFLIENDGGFGLGAGASTPISDDQRKRIDINRSFARAKRNLNICMERVSKARAEGLGSFKLEELLVEETWLEALPGEFQKPYMKNLCRFVECEVGGKLAIYPPPFLIFNALNSTSFDRVKVVIIGQDPYHGPGQAMGLSFSVPQGVKMPSSLLNIFKELQADVGCSIPSHGNLEHWAIQGVLLLNAVLTVRQHQANSHAKRGWEVFTDAVIQTISRKKRGVVFLLWGNSAQEKTRLIDVSKHHVLKSAHPSGLSAHRGFFGCRHFSRTNQILEAAGLLPIDWQL